MSASLLESSDTNLTVMRANEEGQRSDPQSLFASPRVDVTQQNDGAQILSCPYALLDYGRCTTDWLTHWATTVSDRIFLQERAGPEPGAPWRALSYGEVLRRVQALAGGLLSLGLGPDKPLAILSENSIDHALLSLAAQHIGAPLSSISVAYSLTSRDHQKLRAIIVTLSPGAIFVSDAAAYGPALTAIAPDYSGVLLCGANAAGDAISLEALYERGETPEAAEQTARAHEKVGPDTIAKILFTSGSTGEPKGVINTQRMLLAGQQARAQLWTFLADEPPLFLDWLPWSHTFGANHNFNLALRNGGTLAIDNGKPVPGLFERTLDNLREVQGNIYFNVPRGLDLLVEAMKQDATLRDLFFSKLRLIFYAGAALPQNLWNDLIALSKQAKGEPVALVSSWGSTETAPLAADCYFQAEQSGVIGLPVPGVELKLLRNGDKQEIRVRGPNVTPGYWRQPEATAKAFDEEGFYRIGDAVRWFDESAPKKGLLFDGRVAEDFKLMSGTWVNVGGLRLRGVERLAPLAQDIVVAGHDREEIGFLVFLNMSAARAMAGLDEDATEAAVLAHPVVQAHVKSGLQDLKKTGQGSSTYATRAYLMTEPPVVDAGEITDKGYVNQRAVLARRAAFIETLYAGTGPAVVLL